MFLGSLTYAETIQETSGPVLVGEQTVVVEPAPTTTTQQSSGPRVQFGPAATVGGIPVDELPPTDTPTMPTGTVGAGALPSGALNTGVDSTSGTPAAAPQSGSSQLAQCTSINIVSLLDFLIWVKCIIVIAIIPLIFALALMFFLWGVMRFIMANDSTKREEGKKFIIGGLIGLFVMTSLWGIIKILSTTLGVDSAVPLLQTECLTQNGCVKQP